MEKIERTNAPGWLKQKWKEWGEAWAVKYAKTKKSSSFRWRQYKNKGRKDLVEALSTMTRHHCSFCDSYPMGMRMQPTIEHFKPKTQFPLEAYKWENLFLCCGLCQEKGDAFDDRLLKPDEDYYSFDKYFDIDWLTCELIPNRKASDEDRERAEITIKLFRLNDNGKPDDRRAELEKYEELEDWDLEEFSYRFFIERGCSTCDL
ncbi:MAG: hypothetical protein GY950_08390 [bacterium]|nr:hypothetical protein [bacterium]